MGKMGEREGEGEGGRDGGEGGAGSDRRVGEGGRCQLWSREGRVGAGAPVTA